MQQSSTTLENIHHAFRKIDINQDGVLSRAEIIRAVRKSQEVSVLLGLPMRIHQEDGTREQFEAVFQAMDTDENKTVDLEEFVAFAQSFKRAVDVMAPRRSGSSLSAALERADALLNDFNVDDVPRYSRTVLSSSPVLLVMHLEGGDTVPLPHVAVGANASAKMPSLVKTSAMGDKVKDELRELPECLTTLLRLHKRAAFNLFQRWEKSGQKKVALDAFAEGARAITGIPLTDADLLAVLQCVEPVRGEQVLADGQWRSTPLDCSRLYRKLQNSQSRLAHNYIKSSVAPTTSKSPPVAGPTPGLLKAGSIPFSSLLQDQPISSEVCMKEPTLCKLAHTHAHPVSAACNKLTPILRIPLSRLQTAWEATDSIGRPDLASSLASSRSRRLGTYLAAKPPLRPEPHKQLT